MPPQMHARALRVGAKRGVPNQARLALAAEALAVGHALPQAVVPPARGEVFKRAILQPPAQPTLSGLVRSAARVVRRTGHRHWQQPAAVRATGPIPHSCATHTHNLAVAGAWPDDGLVGLVVEGLQVLQRVARPQRPLCARHHHRSNTRSAHARPVRCWAAEDQQLPVACAEDRAEKAPPTLVSFTSMLAARSRHVHDASAA